MGKKLDQLTLDSIAAQKAGMSYGQWKVLHPTTKVVAAPERPCEICGKEIPIRKGGSGGQRKYTCSGACEYERHKLRAKMNYRNRKTMLAPEKVEMVCEVCGKVIPKNHRSPYTCSQECKEQRHRERVKRNFHEKKGRLMADGKI